MIVSLAFGYLQRHEIGQEIKLAIFFLFARLQVSSFVDISC